MTILITGASSGIGLELANVFARGSHDLVLVARRAERLEELKQQLEADYHITVTTIVEDLSVDGSPERVMNALKGRSVDVLVNNAGSGDFGFFHKSDVEKMNRMMHLNMVSLTILTRLVLNEMIARGSGKILNVASVAAFMPGPTSAVYFASKAFVLSFSEALSNELEGTGVTVTVLCPGATSTEFDVVAGSDWGASYRQRIPTAHEVAVFGHHALFAGKRVAIYGWMNRLMVWMLRVLPRSVVLKAARSWMSH